MARLVATSKCPCALSLRLKRERWGPKIRILDFHGFTFRISHLYRFQSLVKSNKMRITYCVRKKRLWRLPYTCSGKCWRQPTPF